MGEKGLDVDPALAAGTIAAAAGTVGSSTVATSTVEKATTVVASTVSDAGSDFMETIKKRGVEATADNVIAEGRDRIVRKRGKAELGKSDEAEAPPDQA